MSLRCVIVENQTMFRDMLLDLMRRNLSVEILAAAATVQEGVLACEKHHPDVLILDLSIPDEDAWTVARRLVRLNRFAKIIVLTTQSDAFRLPDDLRGFLHARISKKQSWDVLTFEICRLLRTQRRVWAGRERSSLDPRIILTIGEFGVFCLIGQGKGSKSIADDLKLSPHTVQDYRKKIAKKLGTVGQGIRDRAVEYVTLMAAASAGQTAALAPEPEAEPLSAPESEPPPKAS
jgi:DNA-binding NarL/FixJ family response regulator